MDSTVRVLFGLAGLGAAALVINEYDERAGTHWLWWYGAVVVVGLIVGWGPRLAQGLRAVTTAATEE